VARILLVITALIEGATGIALLTLAPLLASLLLGTPLDTLAGLAVARVAGAALLSIGLVCWLARDHASSPAGRAVVSSMLFYNVAVAVVLAYAGLQGANGIALWPAVAAHAAFAVWCITQAKKDKA